MGLCSSSSRGDCARDAMGLGSNESGHMTHVCHMTNVCHMTHVTLVIELWKRTFSLDLHVVHVLKDSN